MPLLHPNSKGNSVEKELFQYRLVDPKLQPIVIKTLASARNDKWESEVGAKTGVKLSGTGDAKIV